MRKNFGAKPYLYPMPVFIIAAYGEDGKANAMNAAWGGLSEENEISVCISPDHKTTENILKSGAFTVSMADAAHVKECDYVGVVSGNKVPDKMEKAGFHTVKSEFVNAPVIEELPMAVECILKSYDEETCRLVGEIVNVSVSEEFLDEKGKVDVKKMRPITYDPINHEYLVLGEKAGNAFKDGLTI
ncbi:MAG: flavin reductase family protein [Clostridia bacterium]|nr:flavin reductase family protein [Clostridia bacterium]